LAARSGSNFQCYLNKLGKSYCWGGNSNGQLGNGTTTNSSVPVAVTTSGAINGRAILAMSGGGVHACAIADDENAYCWGSNSAGQLGNNSTTSSSVAVAVTAGGVFNGLKIKAITSGSNFNCAIASDDNAYCWGYNGSGQLGIGTTTQSNVPTAVLGLPAGPVKKISAGSSHICAVASDDRIYCWGENSDGQLGNGTTTNSSSPVAVSTSGVLSGKKFLSISSGELHTCIVADDNKPYCWGRNGSGQLGNGTYTPSTTPVAVYMSGVLNGKTIKALASGFLTNCVIASDHLPYCWGNQGTTGGLGNNLAMSSTNVPVTVLTSGVLNGKTVKALSSGNSQHCVVANDDLPYCWGMNYEGQVGDGTTTNATVPVAVTALP
jgi:alpha-tubulin suppressor-like RCC1 family protein